MSAASDAVAELVSAIRMLDELSVESIDDEILASTPAAVVGPVAFDFVASATDATVIVWIVVDANSQALERLYELVPKVRDVIDEQVERAVVKTATPSSYLSGQTPLPAYELVIEVPL